MLSVVDVSTIGGLCDLGRIIRKTQKCDCNMCTEVFNSLKTMVKPRVLNLATCLYDMKHRDPGALFNLLMERPHPLDIVDVLLTYEEQQRPVRRFAEGFKHENQ